MSPESGHVPSTTAPAPVPSYCLTSNGQKYEEGEGWHDGCRDCYCHSGREMCVLISCSVPSCLHPVVKPDQCCPTCEGMFLQCMCCLWQVFSYFHSFGSSVIIYDISDIAQRKSDESRKNKQTDLKHPFHPPSLLVTHIRKAKRGRIVQLFPKLFI